VKSSEAKQNNILFQKLFHIISFDVAQIRELSFANVINNIFVMTVRLNKLTRLLPRGIFRLYVGKGEILPIIM
jgi:hypothetical protein